MPLNNAIKAKVTGSATIIDPLNPSPTADGDGTGTGTGALSAAGSSDGEAEMALPGAGEDALELGGVDEVGPAVTVAGDAAGTFPDFGVDGAGAPPDGEVAGTGFVLGDAAAWIGAVGTVAGFGDGVGEEGDGWRAGADDDPTDLGGAGAVEG
ncbi:hypothetical protein Dimus_012666 [Dionaea muscipula]